MAKLCERINAPGECRDLAGLAARERAAVEGAGILGAEQLLALLERTDSFPRPERLASGSWRCANATCAPAGLERQVPRERMLKARQAALEVDAAAIAREHPGNVPGAIHSARAARIAQGLAQA